jgi:MOSC domain-containing protein YiiM
MIATGIVSGGQDWRPGCASFPHGERYSAIVGRLVSIVYKPAGAAVFPAGYTRVPLQEAELVAGHGIAGDVKGSGRDRQLNIMSAETTARLGAEGFVTEAGKLGEQLVLTGVDVDALPGGARLRIGEAACVEVTIPRTGCAKLELHQGKPRQEAAGRLGMMARVVVGGRIAVGDPVTVV